jgi:8-oxo-dGTP pyrophosphatase MutT (NUDIX family)
MIKDYSYWIIPVYKDENWNNEFLLINQKTYNGSFWWFPKWHAENGEDNISAAIRELKEEVWIYDIILDKNKSEWFKYTFKQAWQEFDKTVKFWIWFVNSKDVIIQQEELNWYKWANYDDTLNILTHKNMKDLFIKIIWK